MKQGFGILLVMLAISRCVFGQSDFQKIFKIEGQEIPSDISLTRTNHFLISGGRHELGNPEQWPYLAKVDQLGNLVWKKNLDHPANVMNGKSMTIDTGSGYVMMHNIVTSGTEAAPGLLKTDEDGNIIWSRNFSISGGMMGQSIDRCLDGGFILGGSILTPHFSAFALIRTDSLGNKIWDRRFGELGREQMITTVLACDDGGFMAAGFSNGDSSAYPLYFQSNMVLKIDKSGNVIWKKKFIDRPAPTQMIRTHDKKYIICGWKDFRQIQLMKITEEGKVEWDRSFTTAHLSGPNVIAELPTGDLMIAGEHLFSQYEPNQTGIWLVSSEGIFKKELMLEICHPCGSMAIDIVIASDGNPVIVGDVVAATLKDDFFLLKLGNDGCYMPGIDLGTNIETCGEAIDLKVAKGYYSYRWNTNASDSSIRVSSPGTYSVSVWDGNTCTRKDTVTLTVKNCIVKDNCNNLTYSSEDLFIPDVITPNDDGKNEHFTVNEILKGSELIILNRWGERVYQSKEYNNNWDGSQLSSGVYFYQFSNPCFSTAIKGNLTIIR